MNHSNKRLSTVEMHAVQNCISWLSKNTHEQSDSATEYAFYVEYLNALKNLESDFYYIFKMFNLENIVPHD